MAMFKYYFEIFTNTVLWFCLKISLNLTTIRTVVTEIAEVLLLYCGVTRKTTPAL